MWNLLFWAIFSQHFSRNMCNTCQLLEFLLLLLYLYCLSVLLSIPMTSINDIFYFPQLQENQLIQKNMADKWVPIKPNFGPPPPGYIAGLGRGATGFVTRSDLGPAARANNIVQMKGADVDESAYADNKYDSWEGYKGALFSKQQIDEEDRQADDAFDFCERRMEERRLDQKERKIKEELLKQQKMKKNANNTPISQQFTDLKRELAKVTEEEWMNLPEAVDLSIKKRKREKFVPVPDSLISSHLTSNMTTTESESIEQSNQNFRQAKQMLLKCNLEKAENQTKPRTEVDRVGYLTHLETSKVDNEMIGDIKRARLLHKAALASNPRNADVWLSASRIEEIDGKMDECRNILRKALEVCPLNEDIWIELSRVEKADESKDVIIEALKHLPTSEKLWLTIARKENDHSMRSKILRKGLQNLPQSTVLWKQLIEMSNLDQAKNLLYKAIECLPKQIDLWIGLAKLQTYQNAKQVLNKARKSNPLSLAIWISAAKLEETQSDSHEKAVNKIETIITKGRETLRKNGNSVSREELLQEALICERSVNIITCQSIVKSVISMGLTEEELDHSIFKDVELFEKQFDSVHTTRFLYRYGILNTKNARLLEKLLEFQQRLAILDLRDGSQKRSKIMESLQFGLKVFPDNINFWLAMIDRLIDVKNYSQAVNVIDNALSIIQGEEKEKIFLKKVDLLKRENKIEQARKVLSQLRQMYKESLLCSVQAVRLEFQLQDYEEAWKLCSDLFKNDKKNQEIWELALMIKQRMGKYEECKNIAEKAISEQPKSIRLWKAYISMQVTNKFEGRARSLIDRALIKNPKNEQIYLMLIDLELRTANKKQISSTLAKALKECPKCGQIWGIAIIAEPSNTRKKKASVAIENCGTDAAISCAVAKVFWKDNKIEKARKWLEDAINMDKTNGDLWAYYFKFMSQHFAQESQRVVKEFQEIGAITHGRKWSRVKQESADGWRKSEQEILKIVVEQIGDQIHEIE